MAIKTMKTTWLKWMSFSILGALTVLHLAHCAPKDKAKPNPSNTPPAKTDSPADTGKPAPGVPAAENKSLVEGVDFSALESTTSNKSTKALFKNLKDKATPDRNVMAMSLVEIHLEAAGQSSGTTPQTEKLVAADALVTKIKAKKVESLKKSYTELAEMSGRRNLKFSDGALTLLSVLEKNEVNAYSGTSFLTLLWLRSNDFDMEKALVLFEDGVIRLGEIRDGKIKSVSASNLNTDADDLGTLEAYTKGGTKKAIKLKYFVIHEVLKKFAKDPKAWAKHVQKQSNTELKITIPEDKLLQSRATDLKKLDNSELLIGVLKSGRDSGELEEEELQKVEPGAGDKKDKGEGDTKITERKVLTEEEIKVISASNAMKINADCHTQKFLAEKYNAVAKTESEKKNLFINFIVAAYDGAKSEDLKSILLVDLKKLDKDNLFEELKKIDADLVEVISEKTRLGVTSGTKPKELLLEILLTGQVVSESKILVNLDLAVTRTDVQVKPAAIELLLKNARLKKASEFAESNVILIERVKSCGGYK